MKAFSFITLIAFSIGLVACQPEPCPPCPEPEKAAEGPEVEKASGFSKPIIKKELVQKEIPQTPLDQWRSSLLGKITLPEKETVTLEQYRANIDGLDFTGLNAAVDALKTAPDAEWEAKRQALVAKATELKNVINTPSPYPGTDQNTQDVVDAFGRSLDTYLQSLDWLPNMKAQGTLDENSYKGLYASTFMGFQQILLYKLDNCQGDTKPDECDCGGYDVTVCHPQPFAA
jgi:hypothetical protein